VRESVRDPQSLHRGCDDDRAALPIDHARSDPPSRPMCSAHCDGAAAAVVVSDGTLRTLELDQQRRAVEISASVLATDPWAGGCQVLPDVSTVTRQAAEKAYTLAGVAPEDLNLVVLHDCLATAELIHYENLLL
jgi:acetyl-CoA acyltransferase